MSFDWAKCCPTEVSDYLITVVLYMISVREDISMEDIKQASKEISVEGREKIMTLAVRLSRKSIFE